MPKTDEPGERLLKIVRKLFVSGPLHDTQINDPSALAMCVKFCLVDKVRRYVQLTRFGLDTALRHGFNTTARKKEKANVR